MKPVPLYGHEVIRSRLATAARRRTLPASILLHGAPGVGKQRLALWLAQFLLCQEEAAPCGSCQSCRYSAALTHPDLHWVFPGPRPKEGDPTAEDLAAAVAERAAAGGLYAPPSGSDAIHVGTIRSIVRAAVLAPALARRKVFIIGDAERMVPQEGADAAANAFLKLLEEPPSDTTLILTSSVPGSLLPTVRSRVVAIRVPHVSDAAVRAFVGDSTVAAALKARGLPTDESALVRLAAGAPGLLLAQGELTTALARADRLVELAARRGRSADRYAAAIGAGAAKARGSFSETLDSLTAVLHDRARAALESAAAPRALGAAVAIDAVNRASTLASGNVSPQLITASLLAEMSRVLHE